MKTSSEQKGHHLSRKQWLAVVLTMLALAIWIGVNAASRLSMALQPPAPEQVAPLAVETQLIETDSFERWLRYAGSVAAEREAVLESRVTAQILEMPLRSGERVRRGDLLVRLDDEELRRELVRLQAARKAVETELALAKQQLERRRQLFAASAAAEEQVDEARTRFESLQASLEENRQTMRVAESRLDYTRINAPFEGIIGRLHALPGDLAAPGRALVELIDTGELKAMISLPQRDLSIIAPGTSAKIHIPAPEKTLHGRVDRLHPSLQLPGRGALAEIFLNGQVDGLLPGMEAVVRLLTVHRENVVVVPVDALHRRGEDAWVYVLEDEIARRRSVVPGPEFAGRLVVEKGLVPDEVLILTVHPQLADGRAVVAGARP
ncbi:MAG: efflux RND transporter periplasmic adaptor subunit [Chloroflexia bacterium]|nr:efflux RND transporter periplasmic adaptor subunit [Chloroflexia bacterium]